MSEHTPAEKAREALNTLIQEAGQWRKIAEANAREAKNLRQQLHGTRQREEKPDGFSPWKPLPKGEKDEHYIDGHPIEYWHQIATSTLKTNNELIDRVRVANEDRNNIARRNNDLRDSLSKKERINADLEQQLKSAEIAACDTQNALQRMIDHQKTCAKTAQDERDTALRELDAMRSRLQEADRMSGKYANEVVELRRDLDAMREKMKPKNKAPEPRTYLVSVNGGPPAKVTREAFYAMRDSAPVNGDTWGIREERDNVSELRIGS